MSTFQISDKETLYHRKQMYETMKVHGIHIYIESIRDRHKDTYDFYNDIVDAKESFDNRIKTYITFERSPNIKTLRSYGWYIDNDEMPIVAYIPVMYLRHDGQPAIFKPTIDDKVKLKSNPIDVDGSSVQDFLIKDFRGVGFPNTIYYTVKLVPYRVDKEKATGGLYD